MARKQLNVIPNILGTVTKFGGVWFFKGLKLVWLLS